MLFRSLIHCQNCNHAYKGRKERNQINYRCNNRLKNGTLACTNKSFVNEEELASVILKQCNIYNTLFIKDNKFMKEFIKEIIVYSDGSYVINYNDPNFQSTYMSDTKLAWGTTEGVVNESKQEIIEV